MKAAVLGIARSFGYDFCRIDRTTASAQPEVGALKSSLHFSETMRQIHQRDTLEIEELLRLVAFPELPKREGREKRVSDLIGTNVSEGLYLVDALHKGLKIPGDICEFGVAQGATSKLITSEIMHTDRTFWLFDSFEGLPPTEKGQADRRHLRARRHEQVRWTDGIARTQVLGRLNEVKFPRERVRIMKGLGEPMSGADRHTQAGRLRLRGFRFLRAGQGCFGFARCTHGARRAGHGRRLRFFLGRGTTCNR